ncbi:MAG: DUF86 domain-containing protein [Thermoleophilia bacterium]|nr:DUF86 domain-containing protein [Thermoleophilia bacterium]
MRADDRIRLRHMIEAGEAMAQFLAGRSRADLDSDRMLLFAVVRAIEVIGEAAARISEDARASAAAVPWKAIVGMRNRIIQAYWDIDTDIVWKTAAEEVPVLLPLLRSVLEEGDKA